MKTCDQVIEEIAQSYGFETLKSRNSDRLDFHDVSVRTIKDLMTKAFEAGVKYQRENNF